MYGLAISSVLSYFVNYYIVQKNIYFRTQSFHNYIKTDFYHIVNNGFHIYFFTGDGLLNNAIKLVVISILFVLLSILSGCLNLKAIFKRLKT